VNPFTGESKKENKKPYISFFVKNLLLKKLYIEI